MHMVVSLKCPKCGNTCDFNDGRLLSYCNRCGSTLERNVKNEVTVYDRNQEPDEDIAFAWERFDQCTRMTVPTRESHDIESLVYEIERMMDEFMTFAEVLKDILSMIDSMEEDRKHRICEICFNMADRIFLQFEQFLKEYNDFGMYEELKSVRDSYSTALQQMSVSFEKRQKSAADGYWADQAEEYEALKEALRKVTEERAKVAFMDFEKKWELDAEIRRLQAELSRTG